MATSMHWPWLHDHQPVTLRPRLLRLACAWCGDRHLAEDLTQEALTRALRTSSALRDPRALEGWLMAILNNVWRDHLRRSKGVEDIDDWAETLVSDGPGPEANIEDQQLVDEVRAQVAALPLGQRQVLTLVDLEERTYAEVAEILAIPVGTVMSRLSRARAALKEKLLARRAAAAAPALRRVK